MDGGGAADEIVFSVTGTLGRILLNRPQALNALTENMCARLLPQLKAWAADDRITAVVARGAGGKAFCAGGDVVRVCEEGRVKGPYPGQFWWTEYRCNTMIKFFPKPYVALMDGITMGGGVGLSVHGSHRVVTEKTMFAMPETGIGLFPDVGGGYFLPRLPGQVGMYMGLTGRRLNGADCAAVGVAQTYVPRDKLDALEAELAEGKRGVDETLKVHAVTPPESPLMAERAQIDQHFTFDTVEEILASLDSDGSEWAKATAATMRQKSPLSMKVTARQLREGAKLSFGDCMRLDWRLANRFIEDHDFYEGVRAVLVDKDMKPQWNPARLEDVTVARVDRYFAPLPKGELDLSDIAGGQ